MQVLKFGGTSVGSAERMQALVKLVVNNEPKVVVLSAQRLGWASIRLSTSS